MATTQDISVSDLKPTVLNLKLFCKKKNIQGYSKLKKIELLQLLYEKNDLKSRSIVSHYLITVSLYELISFYTFLNDCELKHSIANQLESFDAVVWKIISEYKHLTEEFIFDFYEFLNWDYLSKNPCLTENMIIQFARKINFQVLSGRPDLPLNIIRMYKDKLNWFMLIYTQQFSESFLREIVNKLKITQIDWSTVIKYQALSSSFLEDHMGFIYENASLNNLWISLAENQNLSEDFILTHFLELPWEVLCTFQKLSIHVILKIFEMVRTCYNDEQHFWNLISIHQNLPIDFLRTYKEKINWKLLVTYQLLSEDVILEFRDLIPRLLILQNQTHLQEDFIQKYLISYIKTEKRLLCSVCLDVTLEGVKTFPCQHDFCETCILRCLELKPVCPYCRGSL